MAAVVVLVAVALPPARLTPATITPDGTVPGVFHVHSNRSDGLASPDAIAAIAADVGLKFVVFTDHGDATREPDPPTYRSGVLCIDAVEISTDDGHVIALGLPKAPYPLAGEARDVLEDIHRLGGVGVAAHPASPRIDLQWRDWDAAIDGVEFINLDSEWRARSASLDWRVAFGLLRSFATYTVRPSETIAAMVGDSRGLDARWLALAEQRPMPIFAGVDAHARLELSGSDPSANRWALALPGYATVFRTLTMRVRPADALNGDAARDGGLLLDALRNGHGYASLDAIMAPPSFSFSVASGGVTAAAGDELIASGPVTLSVSTNAPSTFTTMVWRGQDLLSAAPSAPELRLDAPAGVAVYRVEVRASHLPNAPAWILSNGISVRTAPRTRSAPADRGTLAAGTAPAPTRALFDRGASTQWRTESSANARIAFDAVGPDDDRELIVRFGLPGGDVNDEYVALAGQLDGGLRDARRVTFTGRSDKPMRVSVQLRDPQGTNGRRWRRSIYLDADSRRYDLAVEDFRPVTEGQPAHPAPGEVDALLFVVEQTNTKPGTSGQFRLTSFDLR